MEDVSARTAAYLVQFLGCQSNLFAGIGDKKVQKLAFASFGVHAQWVQPCFRLKKNQRKINVYMLFLKKPRISEHISTFGLLKQSLISHLLEVKY